MSGHGPRRGRGFTMPSATAVPAGHGWLSPNGELTVQPSTSASSVRSDAATWAVSIARGTWQAWCTSKIAAHSTSYDRVVVVMLVVASVVLLGLSAALVAILRAGSGRLPVDPGASHRSARVGRGSRCACGGTVRLTSGRYGPFLGCTNYRADRSGCNRAWSLEGRPFGRLRRGRF